MGFLDKFKNKISNALDVVLGETPEPKEPVKKSVEVKQEEEQNLIDENALLDSSKLDSSVFNMLIGKREDEDELLEEESKNQDESGLIDGVTVKSDYISLSTHDFSKILDKQCGCKVFVRPRSYSELFINEVINNHTKVDINDVGKTVSTILGCVVVDGNENESVVIGISDSYIFNIIINNVYDEGSFLVEVREFLFDVISRFGISTVFLASKSLVELKSSTRVKEFSTLLHVEDDCIPYYFTYEKADSTNRRKGKVTDLAMADEGDEYQMRETLSTSMYENVFPNTVEFFNLNEATSLCLHTFEYLDNSVIDVICEQVVSIYNLFETEV